MGCKKCGMSIREDFKHINFENSDDYRYDSDGDDDEYNIDDRAFIEYFEYMY